MKKKSISFVFGMHRSGTSMMTGMMNRLGLDAGHTLLAADERNPKGYFENRLLVEVHDVLLNRLGSLWCDPTALPDNWVDSMPACDAAEEIIEILEHDFEPESHWLIKDPRICILFPLWQRIITELDRDVFAVLALRDPENIASSLIARDGMAPGLAASLIRSHLLGAADATGNLPRTVVAYENILRRPHALIEALHLLAPDVFSFEIESQGDSAKELVTPNLQHHRPGQQSNALSDLYRSLFLEGPMASNADATFDNYIAEVRNQSEAAPENFAPAFADAAELIDLLRAQLAIRSDIGYYNQRQMNSDARKYREVQIAIATRDLYLGVFAAVKADGYEKIVICSAGEIGQIAAMIARKLGITVVAFTEKNDALIGSNYFGTPVVSLADVFEFSFDAFVVGSIRFPLEIEADIGVAIENLRSTTADWADIPIYMPDPRDRDDFAVTPAIEEFVPQQSISIEPKKPVKVIAFYLPQYHAIPENDRWWGKGFTEWTNTKKAKPLFDAHYQPHQPVDDNYYDLRSTQVQRQQIKLAREYGVDGFCFYFYWFAGKILLEEPVRNFLSDKDLDFPFCLCWANENWTRRWDGRDQEILIAQSHSGDDDIAFITYVAKYLRDPRYIRVDGKPVLILYRPALLPSAAQTARRWRRWCRENGVGEIYLVSVQAFDAYDPADFEFDAATEFPPGAISLPTARHSVENPADDFNGEIFDWWKLVSRSNEYPPVNYKLFRGLCPAWDNTARRGSSARILLNSSPKGYQEWLMNAISDTQSRFSNSDERLIFVNAWNEWAEGCHLEPDQRYGYAYLEANRQAQLRCQVISQMTPVPETPTIGAIIHADNLGVLHKNLAELRDITAYELNLFVTSTSDLKFEVERALEANGFSDASLSCDGGDAPPMGHFLGILPLAIEANQVLLRIGRPYQTDARQSNPVGANPGNRTGWINDNGLEKAMEILAGSYDAGIVARKDQMRRAEKCLPRDTAQLFRLSSRLGIGPIHLERLEIVLEGSFIARREALLPVVQLSLMQGQDDGQPLSPMDLLAEGANWAVSLSAASVNLKTVGIV